MDGIYLRDVKHESQGLVCDWVYVDVPDTWIRLYYKPHESEDMGSGFDFYAAERVSIEINKETETNEWHKDYCMVECFFEGVAYFDGIRHLFYGSEKTGNEGYHYYANIESTIEALKRLRELELKYCRDF